MSVELGAGRPILVVDDDPDNRRLAEEILVEEGYEVILAANGTQALHAMGRAPALVLLDLGLPDINGEELIPLLRERDPRLPLVVVSGVRPRAGMAATAFLDKPYDLDALLAAVTSLVSPEPLSGGDAAAPAVWPASPDDFDDTGLGAASPPAMRVNRQDDRAGAGISGRGI